MRNYITFFILFLICLQTKSQVVSATLLGTPNNIEACGPARNIEVKILNSGTTGALSNIKISTTFSSCVKLVGASSNVTVTPTDTIVFNAPTNVCAIGNFLIFTLAIRADCGATNSALCNSVQTFTATGTIGGSSPSSFTTSGNVTLNVQSPVLSITSVSPTTLNFDGNGNACRTITITNGGFGTAYGFKFKDTHPSGLSVTSVSSCTLNPSTPTEATANYLGTILPNASIQITECIQGNPCLVGGYTSSLSVSWGCNMGGTTPTCEKIDATVLRTVYPTIPNGAIEKAWVHRQFSGINNPAIDSSGCLEDPQHQEIKFWNTSTNAFNNFFFDLIQIWGAGITGIDMSTIKIKHHKNDPYIYNPAMLQTLWTTGNTLCPAANVYRARVNVSSFPSYDTLYIEWYYRNCQVACEGSYNHLMEGNYFFGYDRVCSTPYESNRELVYHSGSETGGVYGDFETINETPASVPINTPFQGNFLLTTTGLNGTYPGYTNQGAFVLDITLSPNVTYNGGTNLALMTWLINSMVVNPTSINVTNGGHSVHAEFLHPFNDWTMLVQKLSGNGVTELSFPLLSAICNSANLESMNITFFYRPEPSCSYTIPYICASYPIQISGCTSCAFSNIINTKEAKTYRQTVGTADNDDNGRIDYPVTTLNENLIKRNRYIYKDVLYSKMSGRVVGTASFAYTYAVQKVNYGKFWDNLSTDTLKVYDASTNLYYTTVANVTPQKDISSLASNFQATFTYNLYDFVNASGSSFPTGFIFEPGDSIWLRTTYKNNYGIWQNIGANTLGSICTNYAPSYPSQKYYETTIRSHFEGSPIPKTNVAYNAPLCDTIANRLLGLGLYVSLHDNGRGNVVAANSCLTGTTIVFGVSLGGNSNWFPYEHRPVFILPKKASINTCSNFSCNSSYIEFYDRSVIGNGWFPWLQPTTCYSPINFNLRSYFPNSIPISDESAYYVWAIYFSKTGCMNDSNACNWNITWEFEESQDTSVVICRSQASTTPPILSSAQAVISSPNQAQCGIRDTIVYDIEVYSQSQNGWNVLNSFLYIDETSLKVVKVVENGVPLTLNPVFTSGVSKCYSLGSLPLQASKRSFKVYVKSACSDATLPLVLGWSCSSMPTTQAAYNNFTCDKINYILSYCKDDAGLQVQDASQNLPTDLCDTLTFRVKVKSVNVAYPHDVEVQAILPTGLSYVPNSSKKYYQMVWTTVADPTSTPPTLTWEFNTLFNQIHFEFPGVNNIGSNELWIEFKAVPICGFIAGSTVTFKVKGKNPCDAPMPIEQVLCQPIGINGADILPSTVAVVPFDPCDFDTVTIIGKVSNLTSHTTSTNAYYELTVPNTYFLGFVTSSIVSTPAFPSLPPIITPNGLLTTYRWKLPIIAANDSCLFSLEMLFNKDSVTCDNKQLSSRTISTDSLFCPITNTKCAIPPSPLYTANFTPNLPHYSVVVNTASYQDIQHLGKTHLDVSIHNNSIYDSPLDLNVHIYCDTNNDGVYNNADLLLDTYIIPNGIVAGDSFLLNGYIDGICNTTQLILKMDCDCIGITQDSCCIVPLPIIEVNGLIGMAQARANLLTFQTMGIQNSHNYEYVLQKQDTPGKYLNLSLPANLSDSKVSWQDTHYKEWEEYRVSATGINGDSIFSNSVRLHNHFSTIQLYPNPVTNLLQIQIVGMDSVITGWNIYIYDNNGKDVLHKKETLAVDLIKLNVSSLESGVYFLEIVDDAGKKYSAEFIKE